MNGEPEVGWSRWWRLWLLAVALPVLGVGLFLGVGLAGLRAVADPVRYARPSSLFFPEIQPPPAPRVVPPPLPLPKPEPPPFKYEAEGAVEQEIARKDIVRFDTNRADDPTPRLLSAKTLTERRENREQPGHLAVIFAFDDSGSMGGNDPNNERYRIVLRLLERLGKDDRVCLTRTTTSPVRAIGWKTPEEAAAIIDQILKDHPTMDSAMESADESVFDHSGDDLFDAVSSVLGEVDPKDYRRSLLFLGDGDESNFGYRRGMVESLLRESILMSGVIFGREAASVESTGNLPLVVDAKKTGGEVKGAKDTKELEAMMKGLFEKARNTVRVTRTLRVGFSSRAEYRPGDVVEVSTGTKTYRLRVR